MELSLQAYFDIGVSYGLGDKAFERPPDVTDPDILGIGIRNPLGLGITHKVDDSTLALWRREARIKVDAPEMELGYRAPTSECPGSPATFEQFKADLRRMIDAHPIKACALTIYAVGVVFLRLDFAAGVGLPFTNGFLGCFEYAAYGTEVAGTLLKEARRAAERQVKKPTKRRWLRQPELTLRGLSCRPDPEVHVDEKGYKELRLFTGFTHLALCVERSDDVEAIKRILMPMRSGTDQPNSEALNFEYHGTIHFSWAACVIEPRSYDKADEGPAEQMRRMLACIEIAHTFHGAADAFQKLFLHETLVEAEGFIRGQRGGLNHIELNRLRTLALAVISLTKFETITQAEEDQAYFIAYDRSARLDKLYDTIQSRSEVLLSVQQAEADQEQERRDDALNTAIIFLTGFTVLSALSDVYLFVRGEDKGLQELLVRAETLSGVMLALLLILIVVRRRITRHTSRSLRS
jgi:hypothetical protein